MKKLKLVASSILCIILAYASLFQSVQGKARKIGISTYPPVKTSTPAQWAQFTLKSHLSVFPNKHVPLRQIHSLGALNPSQVHHSIIIPIEELFEEALVGLKILLPFELTLGENYFSRKEILQALKEANMTLEPSTLNGTGITLILEEANFPDSSPSSTKILRHKNLDKNIEYFFYFSAPTKNLTDVLTNQNSIPVQIKRFNKGMTLTFNGVFLKFTPPTLIFQTPFHSEAIQTYAEAGKNIFFQKK